ncbi:MAG: hypothetical protein KKC85_01980 [Gammaproteobacteria bacterium]|nr:hypothetical protein [Gammaproteobacteria bacterium]
MRVYHVPRMTAHLVRKARRTELLANPCPTEVPLVIAEFDFDLLAHLRECGHPSAKKHVRSPPVRPHEREHVLKARKEASKLRRLIPRG